MNITAQILAIGDELLIGQVLDTNSHFIAKFLSTNGIEVLGIQSCSDAENAIYNQMSHALAQADIVICTGGLGPTRDDKTKEVICQLFACDLVENAEALAQVERLFLEYIKRPMNALNRKQALLPRLAKPLENPIGTAPGLWLEKEEKVLIALPGVPMEMKKLMREQVLPRLQTRFALPQIFSKTLNVLGVPESEIALHLTDWETEIERAGFALAYLPSKGNVRLRISKSGTNKIAIEQDFRKQYLPLLQKLLGAALISTETEQLEAVLGELLRQKSLHISTVESCTGGRIGGLLNAVPGASAYYRGTFVAYATDLKVQPLGISLETIDAHSVVSEQVAEEMARKGNILMGSDLCISTTGVAGPAKGEDGKAVGTVCFAISSAKATYSGRLFYPDLEREEWMEYVSKVVCNNVFTFVKKYHG